MYYVFSCRSVCQSLVSKNFFIPFSVFSSRRLKKNLHINIDIIVFVNFNIIIFKNIDILILINIDIIILINFIHVLDITFVEIVLRFYQKMSFHDFSAKIFISRFGVKTQFRVFVV